METPEIQARMGLSSADLSDYLAKYTAFFHSLNDAQKQFALRNKATQDPVVAATAFHSDVTPVQLQGFFNQHSLTSPPAIANIYFFMAV